MKIKDRIKEFKRVSAKDLLPNPKNWRCHSREQKDALCGILAEVGYADALLVRETPDGYMLLDGHLRAEATPEQEVPVLVLDVTEEEADKILLSHDAITGLADIDEEKYQELLDETEIESEALLAALRTMLDNKEEDEDDGSDNKDVDVPSVFQIIVSCDNERHQRELYETFVAEGLTVRFANL
ncbi:hypothetical protein FACS189419_04780 [Planctomycetales bacterium]|nr:hypothetical protein FACS189419_04780 [Planctomycetales bacterium]